MTRSILLSGRYLLAAAVALAASTGEAVIVDRILSDGVTTPSDSTPVNTSAPADDPGWYRVPTNRSAIYLGNQWVLTATHAGAGSTITLPGATEGETYEFEVVPNSDIVLSNPNGFFGGVDLTTDSDLRMFRIKTETTSGLTPEQASSNLANDPFGSGLVTLASSAPTVGTEVLMIGGGKARLVNTSDPAGHFHYPSGLHGFDVDQNDANRIKTWGTNRIATDRLFETNRTDSDNVFPVEVQNRHVIGQNVQFDSTLYSIANADTPTANEAQAAGGDSGGPVFFKQGPSGNRQWVLAGVLHAIQPESGQPGRAAAFGNLTIFSDLSQAHYANQINALLENDFAQFQSVSGVATQLAGYSIAGDINLDGVVSGDGSGSIATDDLAAFVAGWRHQQAVGDILSWKKGDLNLDGSTDLSDFALLRNAFNGQVSAGQFAALIGATAIPEPATTSLLVAFSLLSRLDARRR